ncbi:HAMP domain-containing protein [Trinickia terrae]|uniref:histidine kinase n=1 Tax=Trinickia terrae TaxID=2571161 RepID=A0A4U1IEX2_9BURK|nr:sensor histidine kinase N-terminal domain-containing protein [Trinickia terrae]TKC92197.1 HAMP domain-containing protein [Trinickia terrae]
MKKLNLRAQVTLWLLLPLLALLAFDAWLTYQRAMNAAHAAFDRTLDVSLRAIRDGVRLHDGEIEVDLPYLALEMFESDAGGKIYYVIRDEAGRAVTGYRDLPLPAMRDAIGQGPRFYNATYRDETLRMALLRHAVHDVPSAQTRFVWVLVGETIEPREALAREILAGSLQQEALLIGLAIAIVWLGVGLGLRPLKRLSATVAARSDGDPAPLGDTDLPSEVAPLVESINQYIGRLEQMQTARRRFFADAAHQLKTPLAVIQAESELAMCEAAPPGVGRHLRRLNGAVRHAGKAVQQLLSLSRLDADCAYAATLADVPLHQIARSATLDWSPVARARGIDLGLEQEAKVHVSGRAELLAEMIGNLIDNAIRYAGDGSVITVRVGVGLHAQPFLAVVDDGPGIAPAEREAVFERFYRGAASQAADGGNGLGLSIVREVARVHRAQTSIEATPGGGATVIVTFPVPAAKNVGVTAT